MQQDNVDRGRLRVQVTSRSLGKPIPNARIRISYTGDAEHTLEEVVTDESGNTQAVELDAPPLEYSMEPSGKEPYALYTVSVEAAGYRTATVSGLEVFPEELSIQDIQMEEHDLAGESEDSIVIPPNTLYGDYPPKIPEAETQTVYNSGEIVLSRVVIPEYVVVHDGVPSDSTATDYYVRYRDYIKNVASSEIYATWPDATLRANILAIMSFTMNRVYTEFYRGKGYDFTVTSSTAYDQKFSYGRNYFESISAVVDEMFENYLSRPGVRQPILTQYCDGQRVSCPNWMSQWGSKDLGDRGYSAIEILRYYYGDDMYINLAEEISGIPASWPGANLEIGSTGDKVRMLQEQLARIAQDYPAIPVPAVDGIYGTRTQEAVRVFQSVFGLPETGVVDYRTWYKISAIYVAVTRSAEV
ncbi:MAG: peptidoglycan-binding protein [Clostridiales bacterium]|nr:peptidoglycan-binding protein [Clostridiales bacterium]